MTITLELAPASEARLTDMADQEGQDKTKIAARLLAEALENAAYERDVQAISEGLEDSLAGRVTPLAEWDAKFRARHNIPADVSVEPMSHEEALELDAKVSLRAL